MRQQNLNIIKILLSVSENDPENPNAPDTVGRTPIHKAARNGHLDVIEFLYPFLTENQIQDDNGWTPSHYAAMNGHFDVVKFFMSSIKTPNAPDNHGRTPFELAKIYGHIEREMKYWPWTEPWKSDSNIGTQKKLKKNKKGKKTQIKKRIFTMEVKHFFS